VVDDDDDDDGALVTVKLFEMSAVKLRVVSEGQLSNHKTLCDDRFHAATSSV